VTAGGDDLRSAIERTYEAAGKIQFDGMHYRKDIGRKGLGGYGVGLPGR
jgi:phosphoribosylamine---glycine ligase